MAPTIVDEERIVGTRLFFGLERGDIVGFRYPRDPGNSFVMRIVGLPGEHIEMTDGRVSINAQSLSEPYIGDGFRSADTWGPVTIGEGEYFMLGDNRRNASDSRTWGTVKRDLIWTKIIAK